jgi:membrane associated rhomboid family serine protease
MEKPKFLPIWIGLFLIIVFLLQNLFSDFTDIFLLNQNSLEEPWRFLTAIFLHGGVAHLLYNLFALIFFGLTLERLIGSRRFLVFYLISGILANLASFWFYPSSLGASGAIMAVIGCVAVLRPMMTVWAFGVIMPMFILGIIWIIGSVLGIFGLGEAGIGHIAHLAGILIGVLYGFYLRLRRSGAKNNSFNFNRTIVIPEANIRRWEDWNLR